MVVRLNKDFFEHAGDAPSSIMARRTLSLAAVVDEATDGTYKKFPNL